MVGLKFCNIDFTESSSTSTFTNRAQSKGRSALESPTNYHSVTSTINPNITRQTQKVINFVSHSSAADSKLGPETSV